jgi:hypothetical protein
MGGKIPKGRQGIRKAMGGKIPKGRAGREAVRSNGSLLYDMGSNQLQLILNRSNNRHQQYN